MPLHHPFAADLQTGDLLFPRVPDSALEAHVRPHPFWRAPSGAALEQKMADFLGQEAVDMLQDEALHPDVSGLLNSPAQGPGPWLEMLEQDPAAAKARKAEREMLLLFILREAFPDLLQAWLGMSVLQFLQHPLRQILLGALEREAGGDSFFVGHVAMVLRERDGAHADDGDVWVIEANTTDFSHYGVALNRYWADNEPTDRVVQGPHGLDRMRGWANRRLAQGQAIWHSRFLAAHSDAAAALPWRQRLVNHAKFYLGRPYGFFDNPTFGDAGRLYCGEFVQRVFQDAQPANQDWQVAQNRQWDWLLQHLGDLGSPTFVKDVSNALTQELRLKMKGKPFFLLTLHMLYRSAALKHLSPAGAGPYA